MKREILFKGKSIIDGEWIESMTIAKGTIKRKCHDVFLEVGENKWKGIEPDTLCQYTGIKDKNGNKIFECDYFKLGAEKDVFEVVFEHGCFLAYKDGEQFGILGELQICFIDIIGNKHG
jgi:hypothetical protein